MDIKQIKQFLKDQGYSINDTYAQKGFPIGLMNRSITPPCLGYLTNKGVIVGNEHLGTRSFQQISDTLDLRNKLKIEGIPYSYGFQKEKVLADLSRRHKDMGDSILEISKERLD